MRTTSSPPYRLILLRHGQSTWNEQNLFTGWVDVPLSPQGTSEATQAGQLLRQNPEFQPDVVFTSLLKRSIATANLTMDALDRAWIPVIRSWRLNERHYGGLQGKNKSEAARKFGDAQVHRWRRSFDTRPPEADVDGDDADPDGRYAAQQITVPRTECLKDVLERVRPYWENAIVPELRRGNTVLVAAHGNSLRALVKMLEGISDEEIPDLEIPTGVPVVYELDDGMKPIHGPGRHLA